MLILAERLPSDSGPAFSLRVKPSGTGMFALTVTPTFTAEAVLPRSRLTPWKVLITFLKNDSHGSRC